MIIIKTQLKKIPPSCKECSLHLITYFNTDMLIGCPIIKEWFTKEDIKNSLTKFSNCPLVELNKKNIPY